MKSPTRKSSPLRSEQPQPRHRNAYDCEHEYEFPFARHWTASEADLDDDQTRNWEEKTLLAGVAFAIAVAFSSQASAFPYCTKITWHGNYYVCTIDEE